MCECLYRRYCICKYILQFSLINWPRERDKLKEKKYYADSLCENLIALSVS